MSQNPDFLGASIRIMLISYFILVLKVNSIKISPQNWAQMDHVEQVDTGRIEFSNYRLLFL